MPTPDATTAARPRPVALQVVMQTLAGATVTARALTGDLTTVRFGDTAISVELLDDLDVVHRVLTEAVAQVEAIQADRP
jgi:hypothetical protein